MLKTFSIFIVSFLCFAKVNSQTSSIKFKHIGIAEGLPQNTVTCILQDSLGFIWFGTFGGVARYDGYEIKLFRHSSSDCLGLCNNRINCLAQDGQGNILIGTDKGLCILNPKTEKCIVAAASMGLGITKIKVGTKKRVWVGTTKGLRILDTRKNILKYLNIPLINDIHDEVAAIEEDENHAVWIGYYNRGILRYSVDSSKIIPISERLSCIKNISVTALRDNGHGSMWIGTIYQGILVYNYRNHKAKLQRIEEPGYQKVSVIERIRDIAFANDCVWIGARNGLFRVKEDGSGIQDFQVEPGNSYSISNSSICAVLKDKSGIVWIGTYLGGVNYIQPGSNTFSYLNSVQPGYGLNNKVVFAIAEDNNKNLWIGTGGGGINLFDRQNSKWLYRHVETKKNSIDKKYIESLCENGDTIWIGTLNGLFVYDRQTKKYTEIKLGAAIGNPNYGVGVFSLAKDKNSGVYIGTVYGLFYCSNRGKVSFLGNVREDSDNVVYEKDMIISLCVDRYGNIWVGRMNGLLCYLNSKHEKQFINFNNRRLPVANQMISSIFEDTYGIIWIATNDNGLVYFDSKEKVFHSLPGLYNMPARGIVEESPGKIWVSGINNISLIAYTYGKLPFKPKDLKINKFSVENGLESNEFLSSALKLKSGKLIFGGYDGAVMFDPKSVLVNKYIAPVIITGFQIRNSHGSNTSVLSQSIVYTKDIVLSHNQSYFTIKFSELNFINSANNQYAYTMEGLKSDTWHYVGNDRAVSYTNLSPGEYTFKVKAANNDGYWNSKYTSLHITILYPVWMRWYAWMLYIIAALYVFYFFYSYKRKTNRLKNELHLQQVVNEKERAFANQKMDFFTNISHEIKTPLTLIISPLEKMIRRLSENEKESEQYKYLNLIHRNCKRLMELVTQLLDFRRLETAKVTNVFERKDIVAFIKNIVADFQPWAVRKEIIISVVSGNDEIFADLDADKWVKIINNLMSNALKFTPEYGAIKITVTETQEDKEWITIKVEDNGEGIAAENLKSIFEPFHYYNRMVSNGSGIGLTYVKDLVTLHGGVIKVESRKQTNEERGFTCVEIKMPVCQNKHTYAKDIYEIIHKN